MSNPLSYYFMTVFILALIKLFFYTKRNRSLEG